MSKTIKIHVNIMSTRIHKVFLVLLVITPVLMAACAPENRLGHRMFYDPIREKVMLYGGAKWDSRYTYYNDLWEYDPDSGLWYEIQTSNTPPGRFNSMVTYIPERHELFMFGGYTSSDRVSDTWILDLETMEWTELDPVDYPSPRSDASVSYDLENDVVILFSGYRRDEVKTQQTWVYSFKEENWVEMFPENPPLHQYGHYMVYVPETGQHLMYPGHWSVVSGTATTSHGHGGNIWEYKYPENEWIEHSADPRPAGRYWGNVVYDPDENRIVLFGGHGSREFDDTWSYDVSTYTWEPATQSDPPAKRGSSNMAYDPGNKVFVLFGGIDTSGDALGDTWIMDAETMQWMGATEQHEPVDDPVQEPDSIPGFPLWSMALAIAVLIQVPKSIKKHP